MCNTKRVGGVVLALMCLVALFAQDIQARALLNFARIKQLRNSRQGDVLLQALRLDPDSDHLRVVTALSLAQESRTDEAVTSLSPLLTNEKAADDEFAMRLLLSQLAWAGRGDEAYEIYRRFGDGKPLAPRLAASILADQLKDGWEISHDARTALFARTLSLAPEEAPHLQKSAPLFLEAPPVSAESIWLRETLGARARPPAPCSPGESITGNLHAPALGIEGVTYHSDELLENGSFDQISVVDGNTPGWFEATWVERGRYGNAAISVGTIRDDRKACGHYARIECMSIGHTAGLEPPRAGWQHHSVPLQTNSFYLLTAEIRVASEDASLYLSEDAGVAPGPIIDLPNTKGHWRRLHVLVSTGPDLATLFPIFRLSGAGYLDIDNASLRRIELLSSLSAPRARIWFEDL